MLYASIGTELDLNDLEPFPLTKESALVLQQELREQFSTASFQSRLREIEDHGDKLSAEFKKAQQELVFNVQKQVIPKYGFEASLDGVADMRKTFKRQFSDDEEVNTNIEAINRLIAKTDDPEGEAERAAILELTRERALALQDELRAAFSRPSFQAKLSNAERLQGLGSMEFKSEQVKLVLSVQQDIIPKYGYQPTPAGVAEMRLAIQRFADDPEVSANIITINRLIGQLYDDKSAEDRFATVLYSLQQPKSTELSASMASLMRHGTQDNIVVQNRSKTVQGTPAVGVEIDMNDLGMPLTLRQAKDLQRDLRLGFSKCSFQLQLWECEETFGYESVRFKKVQQQLVRNVQMQVLPKFGYEPSDVGVVEMRQDVNAFAHDEEVSANTQAINKLIGIIPDPVFRSDFKKAQLKKFAAPPVLQAKKTDAYYTVVGEGFHGGILVRLGDCMTSLAHREPLSRGAVVKVILWMGNRVHYEKVTGSGPANGWVSLEVNGKPLLQHYVGDIIMERKLTFLAIEDAPTVKSKVALPALKDKPLLTAIEDVPETLVVEQSQSAKQPQLIEEEIAQLSLGQALRPEALFLAQSQSAKQPQPIEEEIVQLSLDEALSLQNELAMSFCSGSFQDRLHQYIEELFPPSLEFRKAQQGLIFEVQKQVMPKYGFKPSLEGVANMRKAIQKFSNEKRVRSNITMINHLIGKQ